MWKRSSFFSAAGVPNPDETSDMYDFSQQRLPKSYSFEIEDIPAKSEYLEVRYSVSSDVDG